MIKTFRLSAAYALPPTSKKLKEFMAIIFMYSFISSRFPVSIAVVKAEYSLRLSENQPRIISINMLENRSRNGKPATQTISAYVVGKVGDKEVDFIATRDTEKIYYQVTEDMTAESTRERELAPLKAARSNSISCRSHMANKKMAEYQ